MRPSVGGSTSLRLLLLPALLLAALLSPIPEAAAADFLSMETQDLRLLYRPLVHSYLAPYTVQCFENSLHLYKSVFGYVPSEKVTVILDDSSDYGNGAAWISPRNSILLMIAPANIVYETGPANERINFSLNHEMAHIVAQDQTNGTDRFFRALLGGKTRETAEHPETILYGFLTNPRKSAPRWYQEGIAVFMETWMAGGLGRTQGAYDEMVFRSMVRDNAHFYDPLGLESEGTKIDFQVGVNSYLYGTRFMAYMAYRQSPEELIRWVARTPGSRQYFASQFRRVYGLPLGRAWQEWIDWEHEFQQRNLESIRRYPVTPYRDLSATALGSVSRAYCDSTRRRLLVALNYPGRVGHIASVSLDDGSVQRIVDVKGPALYFVTSLTYDQDGDRIFYATDNDSWRDLCVFEPRNGRSRVLIKDARVGELAFNRADRSIWGVRHFNGYCTLVRVAPPYTEWDQICTWPYGRILYDLDISPAGDLLSASCNEIDGSTTLRLMRVPALMAGDSSSVRLHDFGISPPSNFVFSPEGRYLYGSTYYTGVSNIFRYDLEHRTMEAMSNCETGFFRPVPLGGDSLIVFRYTGQGFVPARVQARPLQDVSAIEFLGRRIVDEHPVVKGWNVGSPARVRLDSLGASETPYSGARNIGLAAFYPMVQGYKNYAAGGVCLELSDPGYQHSASLALSYAPARDVPKDERFHLGAKYERGAWATNFQWNRASFYDLFGPTKTSRKGRSLGLRYTRELIHDSPRSLSLGLGATGYAGLERLPDYQNVVSSYDRLLSGFASLGYSHLLSSLGAIDYEKGYKWEVISAANYLNGRGFPNAQGGFDFGFPLPLGRSAFWLRSAAGYSPGDRQEPFANFYFGGFGNNWVDYQDPKRFREYESFPGIELNAAGGTNYAKVLAEWILPPVRFSRVGTAAFYATWARITLFSSVIATNLDSPPDRRRLGDIGSQVDIRLCLLSRLNLTLSSGYAVAVERHQPGSHEWMGSVKIL